MTTETKLIEVDVVDLTPQHFNMFLNVGIPIPMINIAEERLIVSMQETDKIKKNDFYINMVSSMLMFADNDEVSTENDNRLVIGVTFKFGNPKTKNISLAIVPKQTANFLVTNQDKYERVLTYYRLDNNNSENNYVPDLLSSANPEVNHYFINLMFASKFYHYDINDEEKANNIAEMRQKTKQFNNPLTPEERKELLTKGASVSNRTITFNT